MCPFVSYVLKYIPINFHYSFDSACVLFSFLFSVVHIQYILSLCGLFLYLNAFSCDYWSPRDFLLINALHDQPWQYLRSILSYTNCI